MVDLSHVRLWFDCELRMRFSRKQSKCCRGRTNNCSFKHGPNTTCRLLSPTFLLFFCLLLVIKRERERENLGKTPSQSASTRGRAHVYNQCMPSLIAHLSYTRLRWAQITLSSSHSSSSDVLISLSASQHAFQMWWGSVSELRHPIVWADWHVLG